MIRRAVRQDPRQRIMAQDRTTGQITTTVMTKRVARITVTRQAKEVTTMAIGPLVVEEEWTSQGEEESGADSSDDSDSSGDGDDDSSSDDD